MIKQLNSNENVFYFLMGKFFADRKIIKEMDCQIYNEDGMEWFCSFDKEGNINGFISIEKVKSGYYIDNFYVIPDYRNKGIGKQLLDSALTICDDTTSLISRNEIAIELFMKAGFIQYGQRGRYKKLKKTN